MFSLAQALRTAARPGMRAAAAAAPLSARRTAMTQALVLEKANELNLREIDIEEPFTADDVRIDIHQVGICGSDVHYYQHGSIPPFYLDEPMVLGHEASGIVTEVGSNVRNLKVGDRVCMEPGVPVMGSAETLGGLYNLDQGLRFWATPPMRTATNLKEDPAWKAGHGCLRPSVVHPAAFTFALPDHVSMEWGAMVEPLSVGMHAATKAGILPGQQAVVTGAGPIGMMTAMSLVAGGCSTVFVYDPNVTKAKIAESLAPGKIRALTCSPADLAGQVEELTKGGADIVVECAGIRAASESTFPLARPGGKVLLVGCPSSNPTLDMASVQMRELTVMGIFRYRNVYPAAIRLLGSGAIDLNPIITDRWTFDQAVEAFDYSCNPRDDTVKSIIAMPNATN